jgi:hypothetical protein
MRFSKYTLSFLILALLMAFAGILWFTHGRSQPKTTNQPLSADSGYINMNPPTEEEKKAADDQKKKTEQQVQQEQTQQNTNSIIQVKPVISSVGQFFDEPYGNRIEVRAFIPGIYENGGKCKITFSKGESSFYKEVDALKDATTTRCETLTILRKDFPSAGTWQVKVSYNSLRYSGDSEIQQLEVE